MIILHDKLQLIGQIKQARKAAVIAIYCECVQKNDMLDEPLGFAFSYKEGSSYYLNLRSDATPFHLDFIKEQLALLLSDPQLRLVTHNYKSSYKVLQRWGISTYELFFDTQIASALLGHSVHENFEDLVMHYLQRQLRHREHVSEERASPNPLSQDENGCYATEKVECILLLYNRLAPLMQLYNIDHLFHQQEMPLLKILAEMELRGISLDLARLKCSEIESKQKEQASSFDFNCVQQWQQQLHPLTKRLHLRYSQLTSRSGRITNSLPSLANSPEKLCSLLLSSRGYGLLVADYEQIEWVILSHLSSDPLLINAFQNALDIDTETAMFLFGVESENIENEQRKIASMINYGLLHSVSATDLAAELSLSSDEVKHFFDVHAQKFSKLHSFMHESSANASALGWCETIAGRQLRVHDKKRVAIEDPPLQLIVQANVAEIMKKALIAVDHRLREKGLKTAILLQVDNTILFEVPQKEKEHIEQLVKKTMESASQLQVPLRVSLKWTLASSKIS